MQGNEAIGSPAKIFQPSKVLGACAQGPEATRSLSADLIFGYFLSRKSNSLRGN